MPLLYHGEKNMKTSFVFFHLFAIIDEATANIDTETEKLIQESLEKMKSIGTMLVVAHRLSTIQNANQIIVLQNGEVIETGTHQSLLRQKGYYHKLYLLQFHND